MSISVQSPNVGPGIYNPDQSQAAYQQAVKMGLVNDSGVDSITKLANDLNLKLDTETKDYLTQYYLQEQSNKTAWERQMTASNTQYQRAVADLQKAGLNPFLAIQSLSGSSPSASGSSISGGLYTTNKNEQRKRATDTTGKVLTVLGIIAAAVIGALL